MPTGSVAVHCRSCAAHCPQALWQCIARVPLPTALWALGFLRCTATLRVGCGQRNSCNALPHCLGSVGS